MLSASGAEVLDVVVGARATPGELVVHAEDSAVTHFDGSADAAGCCWGARVPEELALALVDLVCETTEA